MDSRTGFFRDSARKKGPCRAARSGGLTSTKVLSNWVLSRTAQRNRSLAPEESGVPSLGPAESLVHQRWSGPTAPVPPDVGPLTPPAPPPSPAPPPYRALPNSRLQWGYRAGAAPLRYAIPDRRPPVLRRSPAPGPSS